MAQESPKIESSEIKSLKEFIEEYQKTLASIGVLIVLGVFWKNTFGGDSVPYISYLCYFATLPLLFEVARGYDYHRSSWNLRAFSVLIIGILLHSAWYIVSGFPDHDVNLFSGVLWSVVNIWFASILDKSSGSLNTRAYNEAVEYFAELDNQSELAVEAKSELKTIRNSYLQSYYKRNRRLQSALFVVFLVGSTLFLIKLGEFFSALVMDPKIFDVPVPK